MGKNVVLVAGTGTANSSILEDGLLDHGDAHFVVAWHDKEFGDTTGIRSVVQWLVKNSASFEIIHPAGVKFPEQVVKAAENMTQVSQKMDKVITDLVLDVDRVLVLFSEQVSNGQDYCEDIVIAASRARVPALELNNGCVPLTVSPLEHPLVDVVDEGDALEEVLTKVEDMIQKTDPQVMVAVLLPEGKAVWARVPRSVIERVVDLNI